MAILGLLSSVHRWCPHVDMAPHEIAAGIVDLVLDGMSVRRKRADEHLDGTSLMGISHFGRAITLPPRDKEKSEVRADVYWFIGRARDVIRRGGEIVSAWEIESIVGGCTEISEAAAVPIAGSDGEEEVALFAKCLGGSGVTAADIRAYCDEVLPRFTRPDHVTVQDSDLPRTQSGKIDKVALRAGFGRARAHGSTA